MTYRTKMALSLSLMVGGIVLFGATVPTFGRRCAKVYEPDSAKFERCIDRLTKGGSIYFAREVRMVPVED